MLQTIKLERIFADKILAAEFYYDRKMYFDVAKHVYDVSIMMDLPEIQALMDKCFGTAENDRLQKARRDPQNRQRSR